PLTIIYPKSKNLPSILSQDQSIGIRIPKHPYCQELIRNLKRPIVSTSANISKEPSPKSFKEISMEIKNGVDFIAEVEQEKESSQASSIFKITLEGETIQIR
ncbi:MAG: Sua5/YciO/YrdC/YwlC family protein, partial [Bacteroidales bacterium]|nr:Sua5/YciO/YrdC/YwlC family protein [Bacteroidales bacterium]